MRRKLRLIKVVVPELIAYMIHGEDKIPDYRCPECGCGAGEGYRYCSTCGSEFDWSKAETVDGMTAKECIKLGECCIDGIKEGLRQIVGVNSPSKWDYRR